MIVRVIDQAVVGINDSFCVAFVAVIIDIAFPVFSSFLFRQLFLAVAVRIAADHAGFAHIPKVVFGSFIAQVGCFFFSDVVFRQFPIGVDL